MTRFAALPRHLLATSLFVLSVGLVAAGAEGFGIDDGDEAASDIELQVDLTLPSLPVLSTLLPPLSLPTLPDLTLPPVTVPGVTLPPVTLPLIEQPGVFYAQEAGRTDLTQLSWSGRIIQRFTLDQAVDCCGMQTSSPDGRYFRLGHDLYDQTGVHVGGLRGPEWGDDGEHTCGLERHVPTDPNGPEDLVYRSIGGDERRVATMPAAEPGTGGSVIACNPNRDRAVVVVSNVPERRTYVVGLTDGSVDEVPQACRLGYDVSLDGRYLVAAESPISPATICDLDTGEVVANLPKPGALSGDGSTILTDEWDACGWYHTVVLWDWRTGERLWSSADDGYQVPCDQTYTTRRFHPGSAAFVLQVITLNVKAPGAVYVSDGRHPPQRVLESAEYAVVF